MKRACFILILFAFAFSQTLYGQAKIAGTYNGTIAMMGYTLKIKPNGKYTCQFANWENGNGRLYTGTWKLYNDTLKLSHTSYRITKGSSGGKISVGSEKKEVNATESWIVVNGRLCARRNSYVDDCLEKR